MASRSLRVALVVDSSKMDRAFGKAETRMGKFSKVAGAAGVAMGGVLAVGMKKSVDAAVEAEKSQVRLEAQMKALGMSYSAHAKQIDTVIQKTSRLAAVDDEDLQDAFSGILRVTGNVQKSLGLVGVTADIAAAKNISLAAAGKAVEKAAGGNATALARMVGGMQKGASASSVLEAAQRKFAGQAEASGNTAAGAQRRFQVALENLQEQMGAALLPIITKVANAFARLATWAQNNQSTARKLAIAAGVLATALASLLIAAKVAAAFATLRTAVLAVNVAMRANPIGIIVTGLVALGAALVVAYKRSERFRSTINAAASTVRDVVVPAFNAIRSAVSGVASAIARVIDLAGKVKRGLGSLWSNTVGRVTGGAGDVAAGFNSVQAAFPQLSGTSAGLSASARAGLSNINALFGGVRLTSGRRSPAENARVGGAPNSDHLSGNAIDLVPAEGWTPGGIARLDRIAAWARGNPMVRWIGWRGVRGHGPGDHLHLSFRGGSAVGDAPKRGRARRTRGITGQMGTRAYALTRPFTKVTSLERLEAAAALAALTAGTEDDLSVAQDLVDYWRRRLKSARKSGSPKAIRTAAEGLRGAMSTVDELKSQVFGPEAVAAAGNTGQQIVDELKAIRGELARSTNFATSVAGITSREAVRALADVISGQIVGYGVAPRAATAGSSGQLARY